MGLPSSNRSEGEMEKAMISRREMLAATAAGAVAATTAGGAEFGNPDEPPQGAINATNPASLTDPGPQNPAIASQFPSAQSPPPTDVGDMPLFWASFNNAPKRIHHARMIGSGSSRPVAGLAATRSG
jgi:oxalate decarboxylase